MRPWIVHRFARVLPLIPGYCWVLHSGHHPHHYKGLASCCAPPSTWANPKVPRGVPNAWSLIWSLISILYRSDDILILGTNILEQLLYLFILWQSKSRLFAWLTWSSSDDWSVSRLRILLSSDMSSSSAETVTIGAKQLSSGARVSISTS